MKVQMKPETIKRLIQERKIQQEGRHANLIKRLEDKMKADPSNHLWGELLQEAGQ